MTQRKKRSLCLCAFVVKKPSFRSVLSTFRISHFKSSLKQATINVETRNINFTLSKPCPDGLGRSKLVTS